MSDQNLDPETESVEENTDPSPTSEPQPGTIQSSEPGGTQSPSSTDPEQPGSQEPLPWTGNVDELPENMQERGRGMLRHMHDTTQEAAKVKREAEASLNDPKYLAYLKDQHGTTPSANRSIMITQAELDAAQVDPEAHQQLIDKQVTAKLKEASDKIMPVINQIQKERIIDRHTREIDAFAQANPDFDKIHPMIMQAAVQQEVIQNKGTLADALAAAKNIERQYLDQARTSIQKQVADKKRASSAPPSKSQQIDIVYAETEAEATRISFNNAKLGKVQDIRVRSKKK